MINISIRKMRLFLSVVEEGSFTRASMRENISQPAATIIINQIEDMLSCRLFERHGNTRKAKLTNIGLKVAETFSRIVAEYDIELLKLGDINSKKKNSKLILVQSAFAEGLSLEWLSRLLDVFDDGPIKVETCSRKEVIERVRGREAILGVLDGEVENKQLDYVQIGSYRMAMLVPEKNNKNLDATSSKKNKSNRLASGYIMSGASEKVTRHTYENLDFAQVDTDSFHEVGNLTMLARLAWQASAPAVMPDALVPAMPAEYPFRCVPFGSTQMEMGFGIITPWGHMSRMKLMDLRQMPCFKC